MKECRLTKRLAEAVPPDTGYPAQAHQADREVFTEEGYVGAETDHASPPASTEH